jgi:hypothetical protein
MRKSLSCSLFFNLHRSLPFPHIAVSNISALRFRGGGQFIRHHSFIKMILR